MFTGIVTDIGEIVEVEQRGAVRRLGVACAYARDSIAIGASIACSGPCLTVVATRARDGGAIFEIEAGPETLARTTLSQWTVGDKINLERALKIGDELGGHLVTGHVDGIAKILKREDIGSTSRFAVEAPLELARFVAEKGSVTLDGVSLTVNGVEGPRFSVLIIPHTLSATTIGARQVGDYFNIEVDLMARYAARLGEFGG